MPDSVGPPAAFAPCQARIELARVRAALAPTLFGPEPAGSSALAAVALVLREPSGAPSAGAAGAPGSELLLIRRAEASGDPWSGHMALPGGRKEPEDTDLLHTAIRETFEEVGIELDGREHLIGRLPALPAMARGRPTGMTVLPLVFHLPGPCALQANHEVAEALWAPLDDLRSGALNTFVDYPLSGGPAPRRMRLPAWSIEGRIVWGLTHRMISNLFELLDGPTAIGKPRGV